MKTEMEKCLAGEWYDCHAPVFLELKGKTHRLLMRYNSLSYEQKEEKYAILKEMFGSIGTEVSVGHSFLCDYGCNIHIGDNVTVNIGCVFVDCNKITVGNNVLIAPNVQIYTATHPIDLTNHPTWVSNSQTVCRNIFGNNTSGTNNTSLTNSNPGQYNNSTTDPATIFNSDWKGKCMTDISNSLRCLNRC